MTAGLFCFLSVIPGWSEGPDPESRDSGFDATHRPGMTGRGRFLAPAKLPITSANRLVLHPGDATLEQIAYVNGSFVPLSEAKVSIFDRGFLFADGIYEVAAVLDGKLVDNASHLARLERSVGEIELALPVSVAQIEEIQRELVKRNNLVNGMVYLEVTR